MNAWTIYWRALYMMGKERNWISLVTLSVHSLELTYAFPVMSGHIRVIHNSSTIYVNVWIYSDISLLLWTLCFFLINLYNNLNCTCIYVLYDFWLISNPVVIWQNYGSMECNIYVRVCMYILSHFITSSTRRKNGYENKRYLAPEYLKSGINIMAGYLSGTTG
jgi:hypothetical protein